MFVPALKPRFHAIFATLGIILLALTGCATGGPGGVVERAHNRALDNEPPERFFAAILARAKGEAEPERMPPVAREHYLTVISASENRSESDKSRLRSQGRLGNDLILRALAEWRLGRLDQALVTKRAAQATGQEAVRARDRALAAALDGVVQLDKAIKLSDEGGSFREVFDLITGPGGAWEMLGRARVEASRADGIFSELLETRLAAFAVLKKARDQLPAGSDAGVPRDRWARMRAQAQVELNEFARLPSDDREAHAEEVRTWQQLGGLAAPPR